jgi:hypothetical protein
MNNKTIKERLAVLETKIDEIKKNLEQILCNHIPHLEERVDKLENNYARIIGYAAGVGAVVAIIIQFLIKYLF